MVRTFTKPGLATRTHFTTVIQCNVMNKRKYNVTKSYNHQTVYVSECPALLHRKNATKPVTYNISVCVCAHARAHHYSYTLSCCSQCPLLFRGIFISILVFTTVIEDVTKQTCARPRRTRNTYKLLISTNLQQTYTFLHNNNGDIRCSGRITSNI